ncbi:hypothetical protein MJO29_010180 [Puccinia striiformis f. sp. tritici]|nr:hypothetical protein MJO29_010180 [Puccinia striiformis f. sp. tritici]
MALSNLKRIQNCQAKLCEHPILLQINVPMLLAMSRMSRTMSYPTMRILVSHHLELEQKYILQTLSPTGIFDLLLISTKSINEALQRLLALEKHGCSHFCKAGAMKGADPSPCRFNQQTSQSVTPAEWTNHNRLVASLTNCQQQIEDTHNSFWSKSDVYNSREFVALMVELNSIYAQMVHVMKSSGIMTDDRRVIQVDGTQAKQRYLNLRFFDQRSSLMWVFLTSKSLAANMLADSLGWLSKSQPLPLAIGQYSRPQASQSPTCATN